MRQRDRALGAAVVFAFAATSLETAAHAQAPAALRPPDSLTLDGIPAIPAAIAEQVGRYTEFRSAAARSAGTRRGARC